MAEDCIFCGIVAGDIPSRTVDEDDDVLAFLDVNPLSPGHTLVIPKEHYRTVGDLPEEVAEAQFAGVRRLTPAIERAVEADGSSVGLNNQEAAGQEIPHTHVHIVPRFEGDGVGGFHSLRWNRPDLTDDEMDDIAASIRDAAE